MLFKKISQKLTTLLMAGMLVGVGAGVVAMQPAYAASESKNAACRGIGLAGNESCGGNAEGQIGNLIQTIVNILSWIVGIAAVIMIIISGLKYITSGGDAGSISSAKSTLVYAIIGLIVVALAQFIVRFVVNQVN